MRSFTGGSALLIAAAISVAAPQAADACGGFFCNNNNPVNQSGEQVIFGVEGDGKIEMWIRVFYEGEASEFAWVIPVPSDPTVGVGVEAFFDDLLGRTNIVGRYVMTCASGDCDNVDDCDDFAEAAGGDGGDDGGGGGGVTVLQQGQTGAYEFVVLSGEDAGTIVQWLTDEDYDVGDIGEDLLNPYIAAGQNLLAMKLQKGRSAGDLQPIRLSFHADQPAIPLKLTAVAATPDMPVHVWVFGAHRAVPTNFSHVTLNPVLLFGRAWEFQDNLNRAMNEAGGRAFTTFSAGAPTDLGLDYLDEEQHTADGLEDHDDDTRALLAELVRRFGWRGREMTSLLRQWFPVGEAYMFCPWEWEWRNGEEDPPAECVNEQGYYTGQEVRREVYPQEIDIPALKAALDERIIAPRVAADRLLKTHAVVTRLTGSISPDEMTVDPAFRFAQDAPLRPRIRQAARVQFCEQAPEDECWWNPPTLEFYEGGLRLATGGRIDERERREALFGDMPAAQIIEEWGEQGEAQVTVNLTDDIHALARESSALVVDLPADAFDDTRPPQPGDAQCGPYEEPSDNFGAAAEGASSPGGGDAGAGSGGGAGTTLPPWDPGAPRPDGASGGRTEAEGCACTQPINPTTSSPSQILGRWLPLRR